MRRLKLETDTTALKDIYWVPAVVAEPEMFSASLELAADQSASVPVRVLSVQALLLYHSSSYLPYSRLVSQPEGVICGPFGPLRYGKVASQPLPADYVQQIQQLATALDGDGSNPPEVRSAARCLQGVVDSVPALQPIPPLPVLDTSGITLTYLCGNDFRLRNSNDMWVAVQYEVDQTTESGTIALPPVPIGSPYSEKFFSTANAGTVRVLYAGNVIETTVNTGQPCAPPSQARTLSLHGSGGTANPPNLTLDLVAPTGATAKYKDSPSIKFSGGNLWKEVGTWTASPSVINGQVTALSDSHLWLGLKNSDDQGTRFDLRVEVYKNAVLLASGESYCIQGVTVNPNNAVEAIMGFAPPVPTTFNGTSDLLKFKVLTRIGTNGSGALCGGHSNAVGLRAYFDATSRPARFNATF